MKKLLIIFVLGLVSICSFAQEPIAYSKVIKSEGQTADMLFQKAKLWVASTYPYASKVIQMEDPEQKMITLRSNIDYSYGKLSYLAYDGYVYFNVIIQCRDGRSRMQIINIMHENNPGNAPQCSLGLIMDDDEQFKKGASKSFHNKVCADIKEKMSLEANSLFESFEKYVNSSTRADEEDW